MTQQLRVQAAVTENLNSGHSTHREMLAAACNSCLRGIQPPSSRLQEHCTYVYRSTHRQALIYIIKNKGFFKDVKYYTRANVINIECNINSIFTYIYINMGSELRGVGTLLLYA